MINDFEIGNNEKNEFNSKKMIIIKDVRPIPKKNINIKDLESSSLHHFLVVIEDKALKKAPASIGNIVPNVKSHIFMFKTINTPKLPMKTEAILIKLEALLYI